MNLRFLIPLAAPLVVAAMLAGACGDDDDEETGGDGDGNGAAGASLGTYMAEVDEIQDGVTQATDAIGAQSEQAFADPPTARQALSSAIDVGESAVASLNDLTPPDAAEAAHNELIAAGENLVSAVQDYSDQLAGVEAGAEFEQIKDDAEAADSPLSRAIERMRQACEEMVALAAANDINVDLSCPAEP